jgi:hypothetical protein
MEILEIARPQIAAILTGAELAVAACVSRDAKNGSAAATGAEAFIRALHHWHDVSKIELGCDMRPSRRSWSDRTIAWKRAHWRSSLPSSLQIGRCEWLAFQQAAIDAELHRLRFPFYFSSDD